MELDAAMAVSLSWVLKKNLFGLNCVTIFRLASHVKHQLLSRHREGPLQALWSHPVANGHVLHDMGTLGGWRMCVGQQRLNLTVNLKS